MDNRRQNKYIGARYVPKFDERGDWDISNEYESLIIVTHQGASYTSKKFVPSGIDITNTDYWVCTGNYSQQVEAYRQEVVNVQSSISDIVTDIENTKDELVAEIENNIENISIGTSNVVPAKKKAIFFGDSFGVGNGLDNKTSVYEGAYPYIVSNKLEMECVNYCVGGSGFCRQAGGTGETILQTINRAIGELNVDEIGLICVLGGFNDVNHGHTYDEIVNAMTEALNTLTQEYPNTHIMWAGCNMRVNGMTNDFKRIINYSEQLAQRFPYAKVHSCRNWQWHLYAKPTFYNADLVHPNKVGHRIIANSIVQSLIGGQCDYKLIVDSYDQGLDYGNGFSTDAETYVEQRNDEVVLHGFALNNVDEQTIRIIDGALTINSTFAPRDVQTAICFVANYEPMLFYVLTNGSTYIRTLSGNEVTLSANTSIRVPEMRWAIK